MQKLTKDIQLTDDTNFVREDKVENAVIYTREQWENAVDWYRITFPEKVGRGKYSVNTILPEWLKAGLPIVNSDDIRKERLWIAEYMDVDVADLKGIDAGIYAECKAEWENQGKPEPIKFLPKGVKAKFIGNVIVDGSITDEERTVYVYDEDLSAYREMHGITGPSGQETYEGVVEDEIADLSINTLVTPNKVVTMKDGKALTAKDMAIADRDRAMEAKRKAEEKVARNAELATLFSKAIAEGRAEDAAKLAAEIAALAN